MSEPIDPYEILGIPPQRRPPTHYDLLGLPLFETDLARIERAAVDRAEILQRLMNRPDSAAVLRVSREVGMAVAVLNNPDKKREYDQTLRAHGEPAPSVVDSATPAEMTPEEQTNAPAAGAPAAMPVTPRSHRLLIWLGAGGVLAATLAVALVGMGKLSSASLGWGATKSSEVASASSANQQDTAPGDDCPPPAGIENAANNAAGEPSAHDTSAGQPPMKAPATAAGCDLVVSEGRLAAIACRSDELHLLIEIGGVKGQPPRVVEVVSANPAVLQGIADYLEGDTIRARSRSAVVKAPAFRLASSGAVLELLGLERLGEFHSRVEVDKPRLVSTFRKEVIDDGLLQLSRCPQQPGSEVRFTARYAGVKDDVLTVRSRVVESITARVQFSHDDVAPLFAHYTLNDLVEVAGTLVGSPGAEELVVNFASMNKAGNPSSQIDLDAVYQARPEIVAEKSVVRIIVSNAKGQELGSGFVLGESLIATNFQVVENAIDAEAQFADGSKIRIEGLAAADPLRDVALLVTTRPISAPALRLAQRTPLKDERAIAIGALPELSFCHRTGTVIAVQPNREFEEALRIRYGHPDMRWVKTSARVAPDNSGGPLINRAREVIGLNTIVQAGGGNQHFAVSADDIRFVLAQQKAPTPLASLPKRPALEAMTAASKPASDSPPTKTTERRQASKKKKRGTPATENIVITLPSGRVLNIEETFIAHFRRKSVDFEPNEKTGHYLFTAEHSKGKVAALIVAKREMLDGYALACYESGEPATFTSYSEGRLYGNLLTWDEDGQKVLFSQYRKDKENGFVCFFQDGELCLVQEAFVGKPKISNVIAENKVVKSYAAGEKLDEAGAAVVAALEEKKKQIKDAELVVKKKVRESYDNYQKKVVAVNSVQGRLGTLRTAAQNDASSNAAIDGLMRRALNRP